MIEMMTLFDLPAAPVPTRPCHYCGGPLSEMDMLLPATCERSRVCTDCCQPCHGAALHRIFARMRVERSTRALPPYGGRRSR